MNLPEILLKSVTQLKKLPGIGEKSATRLALNISEWGHHEIKSLAQSLEDLQKLNRCLECGLFSDEETCLICLDSQRESNKIICVVESISDGMAIENSGTFNGLFHVLGGVLNPLLNIGPEELTMHKLFTRIKELELRELILAINPSLEGDATCSFIREMVDKDVLVNRIGLGIPVGGNLEYLDPLTIGKALENRR